MEKKLYRSQKNKVLGGVCGGIGEYFDIDPTLIRLGLLILFFVGEGAFLLAYIVAWIVIPERPSSSSEVEDIEVVDREDEYTDVGRNEKQTGARFSNKDGQKIIGVIFIGIGALILGNKWLSVDWDILFPALLVGLGIVVLVKGVKNE